MEGHQYIICEGTCLEDKTLIRDRSYTYQLLSFFSDLKYLLKGKVLLANVLPVFTAYWLALHFNGERFIDHLGVFFLMMIGSTLVISGALMLNNWYESDLDRLMTRTQNRPTVTGAFTLKAVLWSGIISTLLGLAIMSATTAEAFIYSFAGWFFYVVLYTFWSKRRYTMNTIVGSISGAFTPMIGWAVIAPAYHIVPLALFYLLLIWQIPHTYAIAIRRLADYSRAGVPMLPVVRGVDATIRQITVYVILLLPFPIMLIDSMGWIFSISTAILTFYWIFIASRGNASEDKTIWAKMNLRYSIFYLVLILLMMILLTSPLVHPFV